MSGLSCPGWAALSIQYNVHSDLGEQLHAPENPAMTLLYLQTP